MNIPILQREPSPRVHPLVHRLMLAPSGATIMHAGPVDGAPEMIRVVSAHSSAYLMAMNVEQTEFALFDAGMDRQARNILRTLAKIDKKLTASAIKAVFLTHGHWDHAGGLAAFPDAQIYASKEDAAYVRGEVRAEGMMGKLVLGRLPRKSRPNQDIIIVKDGDVITAAGNHSLMYPVEVNAASGHTTGSMTYLANRRLIAGDALFSRRGLVSLPPKILSRDTKLARQSLIGLVNKLGDDFDTVIAAHSGELPARTVRLWCQEQQAA